MILFAHHRYRTLGGEEHAVATLRQLVEARLAEATLLIERDSAAAGSVRAAAGLLRGGLDPQEVSDAVRAHSARVVHAHNLQPTFGARMLAAAQAAGAGTVLHLHNYRLVCAVGTCIDPTGTDCTRCHGRNTVPGVRLGCRGGAAEAAAYGAGIALWQRRIVEHADVLVVPSAAARDRLLALGAPVERAIVIGHPVDVADDALSSAGAGEYVLVTSRLAPEKGVDVAIAACHEAGVPLVICGDGPLEAQLRAQAEGADVRFTGAVDAAELAALRAGARLALVPSLAAETFGLAALGALAAGVPVVASRVGALAELGDDVELVPPGDAVVLAAAVRRVWDEAAARGSLAIDVARRRGDPKATARLLAEAYDRAEHAAHARSGGPITA